VTNETKIVPLFGEAAQPPVLKKEPHQGVITALEQLLQEARAGDIVGLAYAYHGTEFRAAYGVVGFVGGYSMQGALRCAENEISDLNRGYAPPGAIVED